MTEKQKHLIAKAFNIAVEAHAGQKDKYGMPYLLHVTRVMERGLTWEEKICGILHDIVEDTPWTIADLRAQGFPEIVLEVVDLLSKPVDADYMEYVKRIGNHPVARRVKLNDLQDNMDIRRAPSLGAKEMERLNKYLQAYHYLTEME